jgi:hypothetical protein
VLCHRRLPRSDAIALLPLLLLISRVACLRGHTCCRQLDARQVAATVEGYTAHLQQLKDEVDRLQADLGEEGCQQCA